MLETPMGSLWTLDMIDSCRVDDVPLLDRIVVAVDPAISSGKHSDETGIITAGLSSGGDVYILSDDTLKASPSVWASRVVSCYHRYGADRVVVESNQGGEMVEEVLRAIDSSLPVTRVHATRGKITRAEPVAALYEQGRVKHTKIFKKLEEQLTQFTPQSTNSPDRLDALVWAVTSLVLRQSANPSIRIL